MDNIVNANEITKALEANMAAQTSWLQSCQYLIPGSHADGAIKRYPDQGWITPYFSNFAAMAMLETPSLYPSVERYLDWYLRNLRKNGTIPDFHYDEKLNFRTARPDSEDAYAGSYLTLVKLYQEKTAKTEWVEKNLPDLKRIARSILHLMDRDGLTFALASYRVKFLMDNCEAYRGLADFAGLLHSLGDREAAFFLARANAIAAGIERQLWNRREQIYAPSKTFWFKAKVNITKFYPDASCQIFPVLYGLLQPDSERGRRLYQLFNEHQPDWIEIKPPDYPWMILGYYACLHGDFQRAYEKVRFAREAYIQAQSGYWFCAESAFFVLTCARLMEHRAQWLG